jgi:hypothetical protein
MLRDIGVSELRPAMGKGSSNDDGEKAKRARKDDEKRTKKSHEKSHEKPDKKRGAKHAKHARDVNGKSSVRVSTR